MPKDLNGHLIPGTQSPLRPVPADIPGRSTSAARRRRRFTGSDVYYAGEDRADPRVAGGSPPRRSRRSATAIRPGSPPTSWTRSRTSSCVAHGAYPSTLGYRGFPKSLCSSVNEVICHGIPDDTVLEDGDIVNIDITAFKNGVHGDSNATFIVGAASPEVADARRPHPRGAEPRHQGGRPGRQVNVIGRAIESYARRFGYGVVRDFTGHGVGEAFHSGLIIPHYDSAPPFDTVMEVGMVFTIEPMLTLGTHELGHRGRTTGRSPRRTRASPPSSSTRSSSPSAAPRS